MRNIIYLFLDLILKLQNKFWAKKINDAKIYSATCTNSKHAITSFATVCLNAKNEKLKTETKEKIKAIVKKNLKTPEKLLEYVECAGTKVLKLPYADKILNILGEQEGFITPKRGFKALFINLLAFGKINFLKSPEMFIMRDLSINIYFLAHQFHKWYTFKMNFDGYDFDTQEKFNKIWEFNNPEKVARLTFSEIINLKEAIKRDVEAVDFVVELSKTNVDAKKASEKINKGGAKI